MYGLNTSQQVWNCLASHSALQSQSRVAHLKHQLQSLCQGNRTCSGFLQMAKTWSDQLAIAGKPFIEDDLISYILSGLNPFFHAFITSYLFASQDNSLTFGEFQTELLIHKVIVTSNNSNANQETSGFALFSRRSKFNNNKKHKFRNASNSYSSQPQHKQFGLSPSYFKNSNIVPNAPCQICGKNGASSP